MTPEEQAALLLRLAKGETIELSGYTLHDLLIYFKYKLRNAELRLHFKKSAPDKLVIWVDKEEEK
jgi:hypothetical protein